MPPGGLDSNKSSATATSFVTEAAFHPEGLTLRLSGVRRCVRAAASNRLSNVIHYF
jgi:hypothetical protein